MQFIRFCRYVDYIQSLTLINCKYIKFVLMQCYMLSWHHTYRQYTCQDKISRRGKVDKIGTTHLISIMSSFFFCNDKNGRVKCKARQQCSQWVKKKLVSDWPTDRPSNQLTERQPDKYSYIVCSLRDFKPVVGIHNQYASICHDSLQEKLF